MIPFNTAAVEVCGNKLVSLADLRLGLKAALPYFSKQLKPLVLQYPRGVDNDSLRRTYSTQQQTEHAITTIMERILRSVDRGIWTKQKLPFFTRQSITGDLPINESETFVMLDELLSGGDNVQSVCGSIYVQPHGTRGFAESVFGTKIFTQKEIKAILRAACYRCKDFSSELEQLTLHHDSPSRNPLVANLLSLNA